MSRIDGVTKVTAHFLVAICQEPSLLPYHKQIIAKELLDKSSFNRNETPKQIAYRIIQIVQVETKLLPILQDEIYRYIMEWLKNKIY